MTLNHSLISELKHEAINTRKMLANVPLEHFDYKPHEKSMTLQKLASHTVNIQLLASFIIEKEELDMTGDIPRFLATTAQELLDFHDQYTEKAVQALENISDESLMTTWVMRSGEHIYISLPKIQALRSIVMNHTYHHRGQLSVYLRLLNIPVPGMYGQSADEK